MTPNPLDAIQARADATTAGPWRALGTGAAGGDHWYICDDGEAIASISAQDGINEDQREPDAEFIAHAREDVPRLVAALRAVEAVCRNLWAESIEGNAIIRESGLTQDAVLRVRAAIREALG